MRKSKNDNEVPVLLIFSLLLCLVCFILYNVFYNLNKDHKQFLGLITRCKDEFFIKEFCDYYKSQGVDKIYIIDDDSDDKTIYKNYH